MKSFKAYIRCKGKARADGIEDAEGLYLATVGLLIDDEGRIDVCAEFLPVANLVINIVILGF